MTIWYILCLCASLYGHLVYVVVIRDIIPILVNCIKKNLATQTDSLLHLVWTAVGPALPQTLGT
jgi:hypothetical protein